MIKLRRKYGEYLKNIRLKSNFSQGEVARKLGYSTAQFISNWERGVSKPPVTILKQLSKIYSKNPDELFNDYLEQIKEEVTYDVKVKCKKIGMIG